MKAQMMQNPEMQRHMEMLKNNPVCVCARVRARARVRACVSTPGFPNPVRWVLHATRSRNRVVATGQSGCRPRRTATDPTDRVGRNT